MLDTATHEPVTRVHTVQAVLDAWGLVEPLFSATGVLFTCGNWAERQTILGACRELIDACAVKHPLAKQGTRMDLGVAEVCEALGLDIRVRAILLEIKWAAHAESRVSRADHLRQALTRIDAAMEHALHTKQEH